MATTPVNTAHPRSRGENRDVSRGYRCVSGSSPLTRGKRNRPGYQCCPTRLIPAHAGKTRSAYSWAEAPRAHPRSRGENYHFSVPLPRFGGSSPLTRGKLLSRDLLVICHRLIPAHAGKTRRRRGTRMASRAHPRSRGENQECDYDGYCPRGSSPLTRGKRHPRRSHALRRRLIPAHAGKTKGRDYARRAWEAHPRSRGENLGRGLGRSRRSGSSPLTRGKLRALRRHCRWMRLIPAHAGKTISPGTNVFMLTGSSPLTRGKPSPSSSHANGTRLIPAHAGKTSS